MPKFFCDYCDVYLTHDSMSVRKAHNSGRNHLRNVVDYYQAIGHEKAQNVIDSITNSYNDAGQSGSNPMLQNAPGMPGMPGMGPPGFGAPPGFGGPPMPSGPPNFAGGPPPGMPPLPPGFPPMPPGFIPPGQAGSPGQGNMPPFPLPGMGMPPGMPMPPFQQGMFPPQQSPGPQFGRGQGPPMPSHMSAPPGMGQQGR